MDIKPAISRIPFCLDENSRNLLTSGAFIWIMQEVPSFSWDVPRALARATFFNEDVDLLSMQLDDLYPHLKEEEPAPLNSYFEQATNQHHGFVQVTTSSVVLLNPVEYLSKGMLFH